MIAKGDRLVWGGPAAPVFGQVIRIRRGEWVDIKWRTWCASWSKRHNWKDLIISEPRFRQEWSEADIRPPKLELVVV